MSTSTTLTSAKPRILRPWQTAVLIVILFIAAAAIYASTRTHAEVRVIKPTYEDVTTTVSTTGAVVPVDDYPARANFSGLVDRIYVKLGQKVHAGQPLLRMKDQYAEPRLDSAKATLDEAEVSADNVRNNGSQEDRIAAASEMVKAKTEQEQAANAYAIQQQLLRKGAVSEAEVDAAKQRLDIANASLKSLQEKLTDRYSPKDLQSWDQRLAADRAQVQAEKVSYANANLTSPIDGTVYILPVMLWDFVPAGADLLHVADLTKVHVRAEFDEPDVGKLRIGAPVNITWDGAPGRVWHGTIHDKPLAVARSGGRTVGQSYIDINDDDGQLPVNTDVAVVVTVEKHTHVLTVPRGAVYTDGPTHFVYRVNGDTLEKTVVQTGLAGPMLMEITGGLTPNDQVVLHTVNDEKLRNGLKVKIDR